MIKEQDKLHQKLVVVVVVVVDDDVFDDFLSFEKFYFFLSELKIIID